MNRRPGHVTVTVETGYCSFCGRPRNLRSEAHQLGTLVRTIVTCEICHRTLSSTIGVAAEEPAKAEESAAPLPAASRQASSTSGEAKPAKKAPAKKTTTTRKTATPLPAAARPASRTSGEAKPAKKATTRKK